MGKTKRKRSKEGKGSNNAWSHEEHASRLSHKIGKQQQYHEQQQQQLEDDENRMSHYEEEAPSRRRSYKKKKELQIKAKGYQRSIILSHDNHETKQKDKLRLHISKIRRDIDKLKERLSAWDAVEEQFAHQKKIEQEMQKQKLEDEEQNPKKKIRKGRSGPETWKLRGAARPAWEVYDFDNRYVDPFIKEHEEAKAKARRVQNILILNRGKFARPHIFSGDGNQEEHVNENRKKTTSSEPSNSKASELLINTCRNYLSSLMQLGLLSLEAKKFKSAREAFLEIIDLEGTATGTSITDARGRLMRMYMEANRPDSARRLWKRLPNDNSVWVRYSAALIEYVSWKILEEDESSEETAKSLLGKAIKSNVFCAYYIGYHDTFQSVMEYTEEVEDAYDGTLEQAIEYCNSEQIGNWIGTEGAIEWLQKVIVETLNYDNNHHNDNDCTSSGNNNNVVVILDVLTRKDLEWEEKLKLFEDKYELEQNKVKKLEDTKYESEFNADSKSGTKREKYAYEEEKEEDPDVLMYAGMFRTAMDMLSDAGKFLKNR